MTDMEFKLPFVRFMQNKPDTKKTSQRSILQELAFVSLALVAYLFWPSTLDSLGSYIAFGLWVLILGQCVSLAADNIKTYMLPTERIYTVAAMSAAFVVIDAVVYNSPILILVAMGGSFMLGIVPWLVYQLSTGKWIGGGDVRLAFSLGILLSWQFSLLTLLLAFVFVILGIGVVALMGLYSPKQRFPTSTIWLAAVFVALIFGETILHTAGH